MISQTSLHRRRNSQTRMQAAEIVVGKMQSNGSAKMRNLFRVGVRQSCESAHRHAHREILPLHVTGRDVIGIRISAANFGYNLDDWWWGVPPLGLIIVLPMITEQFRELCEIHVCAENVGDSNGIVRQPVCGQLRTVIDASVQVFQEFAANIAVTLTNVERGNQFCFRIDGDVHPLVAKLVRFALRPGAPLASHVSPDFVNLKVPRAEISHSHVHQLRAALASDDKQTHNRVAIETREPFCAANRAAFEQAFQGLHGRIGTRQKRVSR